MFAERLSSLVAAGKGVASWRAESKFVVSISGKDGRTSNVTLGPGDYVAGAATSADLIVPDMADAEMVILRLEERAMGGAISAVPLAAGLRARDRDLAPGSTVFFGASAAITARDVSVRVRFQSRFRPRRFLAPLGLIAAGAALLSIAVGLSPSWGGAGEAEPSVLSDLAMRPTLADPEAAAIELRRRIAAAGLTDAITVVRDDQRIVLAGRIDLEDAARVKDIIGAFARQAARVETDLWIDAAALTPGLAAIALAPRAYVVTRDGQRLQIGDRFADGSRLEAIDDESVRLNRDGIALNVKF